MHTLATLLSVTLALSLSCDQRPKAPADPAHLACEVDSDCAVAWTDCCTGTPVNAAFVELYRKKYDTRRCASMDCAVLSARCVSKKCQSALDGRL